MSTRKTQPICPRCIEIQSISPKKVVLGTNYCTNHNKQLLYKDRREKEREESNVARLVEVEESEREVLNTYRKAKVVDVYKSAAIKAKVNQDQEDDLDADFEASRQILANCSKGKVAKVSPKGSPYTSPNISPSASQVGSPKRPASPARDREMVTESSAYATLESTYLDLVKRHEELLKRHEEMVNIN